MPFKIISVTGAHSKVGKTTLCSIILKNLEGFGAIKCTKSPLYTSVVDDPDVIFQKDKDTAIMSDSGAEKVVWVRSSGNELEDALHIAMGKMEGLNGVVIEGNSPVRFLDPDLIIFIIGQDGEIKPSAAEVSSRADIVVINTDKHMQNQGAPDPVPAKAVQTFRMGLFNNHGENDKFLAYIKQYINE